MSSPQKFDIAGPVTHIEGDDIGLGLCQPGDTSEAAGYFVLEGKRGLDCPIEEMIRHCHRLRCLGVIFRTRYAVAGRAAQGWFWGYDAALRSMPPLVELNHRDWDGLLASWEESLAAVVRGIPPSSPSPSTQPPSHVTIPHHLALTVRVTAGDVNLWRLAMESTWWLFACVLLCLMALANAATCCYLLNSSLRRKIRPWLAIVCVSIELIANLIRASYLALDPFHSNQIFSFPVDALLYYVPVHLTLLSAVLVGLFWLELAQEASRGRAMGSFVRRFRWLWILAVVTVIAVELLSLVASTLFFVSFRTLAMVNGVGLSTSLLVVNILIVVSGVRVWRSLGDPPSSPTSTSRLSNFNTKYSKGGFARELVQYLIASCVCRMFVLAVGPLMSSLTSIFSLCLCFWMTHVALTLVSVFQIWMLKPKDKRRTVQTTAATMPLEHKKSGDRSRSSDLVLSPPSQPSDSSNLLLPKRGHTLQGSVSRACAQAKVIDRGSPSGNDHTLPTVRPEGRATIQHANTSQVDQPTTDLDQPTTKPRTQQTLHHDVHIHTRKPKPSIPRSYVSAMDD